MHLAYTSINSLETVVDFAISLEKFGKDYYVRAQDMVMDPACKEFFSWLIKEEEDHCNTYQELYEQQFGAAPIESELLGGYGRFIELLVQEVTANLTVHETLTIEEALEKALGFEDAVIRYFQEVKTLFPAKQQAIIEKICQEENKHIDEILEFRKGLKS